MKAVLKSWLKKYLSPSRITMIRTGMSLPSLVYAYVREDILGQRFPLLPAAVNLLANDICNSRCQMCLIWQRKQGEEISPEECLRVLNDPLFDKLKYVGISGGEPTLRKDLPEFVRQVCQKKPRLQSAGIITNAIQEKTVKERVLECARICRENGVGFNVMVSLDGVGDIHDRVRGRKNNFESALNTITYLKDETDIPVLFGSTVTAENAAYVDELLEFAKARGFYGRFRIAEFIKRLYNEGQTEFIRAFDDRVRYHLSLFFFRLEHDFETQPMYKKTYRNIRGMIGEDQPRKIGCPYQNKAAVITSRGELLYCAPQSPVVGDTLTESAKKLYLSRIDQRRAIIKTSCQSCIHDYHVPVNLKDVVEKLSVKLRMKIRFSCRNLAASARRVKKTRRSYVTSTVQSASVMIVGWYGTETAGDKAILWTVIQELKQREHPPAKIYLSSLFPFISRRTLVEMELPDVEIVETYTPAFRRLCGEVEELVVGGGPLMDIDPLNHILYAFRAGARRNALCRIAGCGLGPLKQDLYLSVVKEILRLSDHITVRDDASAQFCREHFGEQNVRVTPDPASGYVQYVRSRPAPEADPYVAPARGKICCFVREWSREYLGDYPHDQYESVRDRFETQLAHMILQGSQTLDKDVYFLSMHTFYVGGDDRVVNRRMMVRLKQAGLDPARLDYARLPMTPAELLRSMSQASFNICMRFHSVLFAENLGVPYLAVDYTQGGKIRNFLKERGRMDRLFDFNDVLHGRADERIRETLLKQSGGQG